MGAGASSGMPAFFLIFFTAAASWEVTVSRHAEEGHLDRWLSNCAVTCAICSSTGERATSATGAATYKGGMRRVRRRSGIKIEIAFHWNIHQQPSFDAGTKCGAVRQERGAGIGGCGTHRGESDGGGCERRDDRALHVGDASVAGVAGSGHDARTRDTAGSLLRRASGNEPRGLLRREGGRVRGVNDGGHLWCAWTRKSVGACAVRMEDAREHWRANTQRPKPTKR